MLSLSSTIKYKNIGNEALLGMMMPFGRKLGFQFYFLISSLGLHLNNIWSKKIVFSSFFFSKIVL